MNLFEKVLYFISTLEMERPVSWGWFHLMWLGIVAISLIALYLLKNKYNEKQLKTVLLIYGITAFTLELIKQLMWSLKVDPTFLTASWSYTWYAAPFQLCTTPIYVTLICAFLKDGKLRNNMLSFMVFYTILGSLCTMILPDSCFVSQIEVNIHTMFLHCMSFVISVYLVMNKVVKVNLKNLLGGYKVFLVFVLIALLLDIGIYNTGILNGETFNMFFISPYFNSTLPVFSLIQPAVPYPVFLLIYLIFILLGGFIVFAIFKLLNKILHRKNA